MTKPPTTKGASRRGNAKRAARIDELELRAMIEEATVDAHDDAEQATGWFTMLEEHLALPFETRVLGTPVAVVSIDLREGNQIVAICKRGRHRQAIALVDLPLPSPPPAGAEWIEAYRAWLGPR